MVTDFSTGVQVAGMFQTERFISVIESAEEFKALHKYSRTQFAIFFLESRLQCGFLKYTYH